MIETKKNLCRSFVFMSKLQSMMNKLIYLKIVVFSFAIISFTRLPAQTIQLERQVTPFPVNNENGVPYTQPLSGGINKPVQQFVDIDNDSDNDLFLVEQDQPNSLKYYKNIGTPSIAEYEWITDSFQSLQVGAWFTFVDMDSDGDFDIYTDHPFGIIRYYKNNGSPQNPVFTLSLDTLRDSINVPIETEAFSIPEWADIDGDNDPDLFMGRLNGRITYYRNSGLDPSFLPQFTFVTDTFQGIDIQTGGGIVNPKSTGQRHGANSLTFVDIDDDQDNDLFWGDFFAPSIIHLENYGSAISPLFIQDSLIEQYPPNNPISSGGFNVPRFSDIDGDTDLDMFLGILGGSVSPTANIIENFYFYENIGSPAMPNFNLETTQFLSSIDIGQNSIPALVDIDDDGDQDLFLANQEDLDSPDVNSRLFFFENQGSLTSPEYRLINTHYLNYDKFFDVNYAPAFGDIDDDDDFDLFIGKFDGKITFWQNEGSSTSPNLVRITENYAGIDIGSNSLPTLADIDADQDLDLFIGEFNGNINFYRNIGSATTANFQLDTTHYFGINLGQTEFSYPHFHDIDRDGDLDLFIGNATLGVLFYRNTGTAQSANFVFDNSFNPEFQLRSSPNFTDIDADGDSDMFSGSIGGGLLFYENREFVNIKDPSSHDSNLSETAILYPNFPNPFNPKTVISYQLAVGNQVNLSIHNVTGQRVAILLDKFYPAGFHQVEFDASQLASGIYFYRLQAGKQVVTRKMVLMK
jgi:hypothetical protein